MKWKEWPAWLKGGIIGLVIETVFLSIIFSIKCNVSEMVGGGGCSWSLNNLIDNLVHLFNEAPIVKFIALAILIVGFLIGALIGWIIGKIKSKKE